MFRDRSEAGDALAEAVSKKLLADAVILALPPGGVPVARRVAARLGAPFDLFMVKPLGAPEHPEIAVGAITTGGVCMFSSAKDRLGFDDHRLDALVLRESEELARRERVYRNGPSHLSVFGREVVIIDDGLAGESVMPIAVEALRKIGAARVVVAVPAGETIAIEAIGRIADDVVCLLSMSDHAAASMMYRYHDEVTEREVSIALREARGWMEPVLA